jgi:tetratricopeptide (TPR) repeat protein
VQLENRVFSQAESAKISDRFVAVRMLGGLDETPEVEQFMQRYEVEGFPTLLAMTADGAVLSREIPRNVDGILAAMEDAQKSEVDFQAKKTALAGKSDPESLATMAKMHLERYDLPAAQVLYAKVVASTPTAENYGMLAAIYGRTGQKDEERRTLQAMVQRFADSPERMEWRIQLATIDLPNRATTEEEFHALVDSHMAALSGLLAEVEKEKSVAGQSEIRFRLGKYAEQKQDFAAMKAHLAWIVENDPKGKFGPKARMILAFAAFQDSELETAVALLEKLVADSPESPEAAQAREVLPQIKEELAGQKEGGDEAPEDDMGPPPAGDGR